MWQLGPAAVPGGPPGFGDHGISLLTGWLPLAVQLLAAALLVAAVLLVTAAGRRGRRWLPRSLPALAAIGVAAALLARAWVSANGLASDPAPTALWVWTGLAASALALVVLGWRGVRWWRRAIAVLAVPLALLSVGVVLNDWVGYFPTVTEAWGELTAGPLPDQVDAAALGSLAGTGATMRTGKLVGVDIPATASHFAHREEYVYLPPAYFTPDHAPLPTLMMISGEFNTPADWIRVGDAVATADAYAAAHQGTAPVLAFVDSGGSFNNDTECVDGPRGNVATYLAQDVPAYLESTFHVAAAPSAWGVVGWSAGGTCALDLAVVHPDRFGTFEDIAGDLGPNAGDKATTIARLYGGNAAAWAAFDPLTVLAGHARYADTAGWFDNAADSGPGGPGGGRHRGGPGGGGHGPGPGGYGPGSYGNRGGGTAGLGGRADGNDAPGSESTAAATLCTAAEAKGIACTLHTQDGRHSWQFATTAFRDALPWLATRVGVAGPSTPSASGPGALAAPAR